MDSLSQSGASSPQEDAATPPIELSDKPSNELPQTIAIGELTHRRLTPLDWIVRLSLFGLLLFLILRQVGSEALNDLIYPGLVFGVLAAGYLLASVPAFANKVRQVADQQPLSMALLPLALLLPVMVQARATPDFDFTEILFAGVMLILPTACAILNVSQLHRGDIPLGLITLALPLVLPFARLAQADAALPRLDALGIAIRAGALVLPVLLLLLLTSREQKQRLNFLFVCAVLSLWYAAEFGAFPEVLVSPNMELTFFQFAVIPLFLYVVATGGRFDRIGLVFQPTPRSVSIVSSNFALFAVLAVPIGLVTGFLSSAFAAPTPLEGAINAVTIFLLIALPQEILFRGTILTYLQDVLRLPVALAIGVSAVIFGLAHVNNTPNPLMYIVLATLAGIFYARVFLATRNVTASAVVHTAVNWAWWLLFRG